VWWDGQSERLCVFRLLPKSNLTGKLPDIFLAVEFWCVASLLQAGSTSAAPVPCSAQTAPNKYADSVR
jgi:hypothetical protein